MTTSAFPTHSLSLSLLEKLGDVRSNPFWPGFGHDHRLVNPDGLELLLLGNLPACRIQYTQWEQIAKQSANQTPKGTPGEVVLELFGALYI